MGRASRQEWKDQENRVCGSRRRLDVGKLEPMEKARTVRVCRRRPG